MTSPSVDFDEFVRTSGDRLRRVLVAQHGVEDGCDLAADALSHAWQHWDRVGAMDNAVGYLYRVAQSASRRHRRWRRDALFPAEPTNDPAVPSDTHLPVALTRLNDAQRTCVVLVHVFGWSYADVGDVLDVPVSTVRNHVHRGLRRLRSIMEDTT